MSEKFFTLKLSKIEFLMVKAAIDRDRKATSKAVKRGIAHPVDLAFTDDLSDRLCLGFFDMHKDVFVSLDALDCLDKWGQS